ncbi:UNVERIFIED_CONTAM: 26S proteasome regulatory subunitB [Sesamum calycinum]|uniref:26S proteasome regulatory subunitB n=1 Tax=Sesamum calycinum TaxID=2727403 RepID=A0AAW2NUQ4_9LAMI
MVYQNNGIICSTTASNYCVRILSTINRELLKPAASVALHRHSNGLVHVLPPDADSSISLLTQSEKPDVTYNMDGFDQTVNVKVIMATNRADTLDPALLRPGRLDRKIEFPLPDRRQKRLVFRMTVFMHLFSLG